MEASPFNFGLFEVVAIVFVLLIVILVVSKNTKKPQ